MKGVFKSPSIPHRSFSNQSRLRKNGEEILAKKNLAVEWGLIEETCRLIPSNFCPESKEISGSKLEKFPTNTDLSNSM